MRGGESSSPSPGLVAAWCRRLVGASPIARVSENGSGVAAEGSLLLGKTLGLCWSKGKVSKGTSVCPKLRRPAGCFVSRSRGGSRAGLTVVAPVSSGGLEAGKLLGGLRGEG